eukprot:2594969-Amphidinium_carterae.1
MSWRELKPDASRANKQINLQQVRISYALYHLRPVCEAVDLAEGMRLTHIHNLTGGRPMLKPSSAQSVSAAQIRSQKPQNIERKGTQVCGRRAIL